MSSKFKVGLIGAGHIAGHHVSAIKKLAPEVELIGVFDSDRKRSQGFAEQWDTISFNSLDQLVDSGSNVIHILTSPGSHAKLAIAALDKGCHVLIEKPVAETEHSEADALEIARLAHTKGLTVSVDHSQLYDPQIRRALDAAKSGALGTVTSVELVRGVEYPPYEGGELPARYRHAGYPFRDLGIHGLYVLLELLGDLEEVDAEWSSLGGDPNLAFDEWRANVRCRRGLGQLRLSFNLKPAQSQLIIHGTTQVLRVELGKRPSKLPERLAHAFQPLLDVLSQPRKDVVGLHELIAEFYKRLATGEAPPVAVEDAAQIVKWVDKVARAADADHAAKLSTFKTAAKVPFLVTGASGSLGKATVKRLLADGHKVRVLVRRIPAQPEPNVEYVFGNLGDPDTVDRAVAGAETVIHLGAATKGGWPEHKGSTVVGTANVIHAVLKHKVKQLVYISSMSVVDWAGLANNGPVSEAANLEPRPEERGAYTQAKLAAEKLVVDAAKGGLPVVILRPGQIFGGGIPLINGAVARKAGGRWLVLGDGKLELPLVYIDDVVDAVMNSIAKQLKRGEVIQIIDPEHLTQEDVLGLSGTKKVLHVPRPVVFMLGKLSEIPLGALGRQSPIAVYRLKSAMAQLHYESGRAHELLGWAPRVGVREGIKRVSS
ncbi:MAG: NAD-dependent epimerase/dehydratase family protein [Kofleriaceae bacterium]